MTTSATFVEFVGENNGGTINLRKEVFLPLPNIYLIWLWVCCSFALSIMVLMMDCAVLYQSSVYSLANCCRCRVWCCSWFFFICIKELFNDFNFSWTFSFERCSKFIYACLDSHRRESIVIFLFSWYKRYLW